ncbi:MAG TPA: serine hydrolase domain-containing protein, partial [Woeseiaceae bacterium]
MKMLCQTVLLLLFPLATVADESDRRAFFSPEGRVQKFQSAESIYPVRTVNAGPDVWKLPRSSQAGSFSPSYEFGDEEYGIDEFNERTKTNALLVLKDGEIVYETYLNGSKPETRFVSFSTGKSFTSTVVGIAIEEGLIKSVNEPLTRHLPSLTGSAYDGITFRDALQMVSGVEWDESDYDWTDESQPLVRLWNHSYVEQRYRFVEGANTLRRVHPPGQSYNYNTMETSLLGWAVENAANKRFSKYFEEKLWQPAGMEFDAAWVLDGPEEIGREMTGG